MSTHFDLRKMLSARGWGEGGGNRPLLPDGGFRLYTDFFKNGSPFVLFDPLIEKTAWFIHISHNTWLLSQKPQLSLGHNLNLLFWNDLEIGKGLRPSGAGAGESGRRLPCDSWPLL